MTSTTIPPLSPDFEVLYFKQKQGENLKDVWYRMIGFYRVCALKGDMKILLRSFYVGLSMPYRQLLDFAAKGNFIEIDSSIAYEIIEGIVGTPPPQKVFNCTQEGVQILENLGDMQKSFADLQKSSEPLKNISGNLNRMNNLLTICNKRLDTLDNKIALIPEDNLKHKEPPGFEKSPTRVVKTKDGNT
jgi:hypothetical protein